MESKEGIVFDEPGLQMAGEIDEIPDHEGPVFEEWAAVSSGDLVKNDVEEEEEEEEEEEDGDELEKITEIPFRRNKKIVARRGNQRPATIAPCEVCGVVFKYPSRIKEHMRIHTGEKPFQCDICGMRFTQRTPMVNHYRVQHMDDLPYSCNFGCGKRFVNVARKNAHELGHIGLKRNGPPRPHLKPDKKLICAPLNEDPSSSTVGNFVTPPSITNTNTFHEPSTSSRPSESPPYSIKSHSEKGSSSERIDDVISSVLARVLAPPPPPEAVPIAKPVEVPRKRAYVTRRTPTVAQCNICGLMLRHPSKIAEHIRTHTGEKPYECGECGLCLSTATSLKVHIRRMHTGERPYQCQWACGMWFVTESVRKEHELAVHSTMKRYTCSVKGCNTVFARRNYLIRHRKNVHGQVFVGVYDPLQVVEGEPMVAEEQHVGDQMIFEEEVKPFLTRFDEEEFVEQGEMSDLH
uniref:C2H2-type domain-containing protein n=1 Tax=Caenorhabditis japonica TaxID=281687 RepID=A0A8R1DSJ0_CAEJA